MATGAWLVLCALPDRRIARREPPRPSERSAAAAASAVIDPLRIDGALNLVWLLGVVATVFVAGSYGRGWFGSALGRTGAQVAALIALAALSIATTPRRIHDANRFSWAPIHEVAGVFVGVFFTMVPALSFLQ